MLTGISFANVEAVVAVNLTLRESSGADDILLHPDGSFRGFVPVKPGLNRIRVSALASDGTRGSTELDIHFNKIVSIYEQSLPQKRSRVLFFRDLFGIIYINMIIFA